MAVAGIFLAHRKEEDTLCVGLDYVLPEYRDFKNGRFIYGQLKSKFIVLGFKNAKAEVKSKKYSIYLKKLGFVEEKDGRIFGYEFKWKSKRITFSETFMKTYNSEVKVIDRNNFREFVVL